MAGAMRPTSPIQRIEDRRVSVTYGKEEKQFGFAGSDTKADRDLIIREAFSIPLDSSFRLRGEDGAYLSSSALEPKLCYTLECDTVDGETFFPEPALLCVRDGHAGSPILNGNSEGAPDISHSMLVVLLVPRVKLVHLPGDTRILTVLVEATFGTSSTHGASPLKNEELWYMSSFELEIYSWTAGLSPYAADPVNEEQSVTESLTTKWSIDVTGGIDASAAGPSGSLTSGYGHSKTRNVTMSPLKCFSTTFGYWTKASKRYEYVEGDVGRWEVELTSVGEGSTKRYIFVKNASLKFDEVPREAFGYKNKRFSRSWVLPMAIPITGIPAKIEARGSLCLRQTQHGAHYVLLERAIVIDLLVPCSGLKHSTTATKSKTLAHAGKVEDGKHQPTQRFSTFWVPLRRASGVPKSSLVELDLTHTDRVLVDSDEAKAAAKSSVPRSNC